MVVDPFVGTLSAKTASKRFDASIERAVQEAANSGIVEIGTSYRRVRDADASDAHLDVHLSFLPGLVFVRSVAAQRTDAPLGWQVLCQLCILLLLADFPIFT